MRRSNQFRIAICLVILLTLFSPPLAASACSCIEPGSPSHEFARADGVFTGKVIRIVDNYVPIYSSLDKILQALGRQPYFFFQGGKNQGYSVDFAVTNSWKAITETVVVANTGYGAGDCGYFFVTGNDYLVYTYYAYGKPGNYWVTSICSRTTELASATEDLTYLNTLPRLPLKPSFRVIGLLIDKVRPLLGLILITGMIFLFAYKRRKSRLKEE